MSQSRILSLLGPALVAYLVADVAASLGGLDPQGWILSAVALALSAAPLAARRRAADGLGGGRAGALGVLAGVALVGAIDPLASVRVVRALQLVSLPAMGALVVDLALTAPDRPRALGRLSLLRGLVPLAALGAAALAVSAQWGVPLPAGLDARGTARVSVACLGAGLALAFALRLLRRAMGSAPEDLASNTWATLGLLLALLGLGAFSIPATLGAAPIPAAGVALAGAAAALVASHLAMVDPARRAVAGEASRALVTALASLGVVAAAFEVAAAYGPHARVGVVTVALAGLVLGVLAHRALRPAVRALLAPHRGRLLDAVAEARAALRSAASLEDAARATLPSLRRASSDRAAEPILFVSDPPREVRIDAAGEPRMREAALPEPLVQRILQHPRELLALASLERLVVRRPELRALVDVLGRLDALCAVPLSVGGELEGVLVVPRGARRSGLGLEELEALRALGEELSVVVGTMSAQLRAQDRAGRLELERRAVEEAREELEAELARTRADAGALKAGRAAHRMTEPPVAYSGPMRALVAGLDERAPTEAPILLVAEGGTPVDRLAHRVHAASGRAQGPFVIADCASVRAERVAAALFGELEPTRQPGWLELASGGTLFLVDVCALPLEVQAELALALSERQARPVGGVGVYAVDVRVVATTRLPLGPLSLAGAFDAEFARWIGASTHEVPPLRQRREDLASLVLLALDRACRVLGRAPVGIEQPALEVLLGHAWPGNVRELQWVLDSAVARATGSQVRVEDLPLDDQRLAAVAGEPEEDPLAGTYAELERKILRHALARAGGNKSEAARGLGLKRTTFLDRIRRLRIEEGGEGDGEEDAPLS